MRNLKKVTKSVGGTWMDATSLPDDVNAGLRQYRVRILDLNNLTIGQFGNAVAGRVGWAK